MKEYIVSLTEEAMEALQADPQSPALESLRDVLMSEEAALAMERKAGIHTVFRLVTPDGDPLGESRAGQIADKLLAECPGVVDSAYSRSVEKSYVTLCFRFSVAGDPAADLFFTEFASADNENKLRTLFQNAARDARKEGITGVMAFDGMEFQSVPRDVRQRRPADRFAADRTEQVNTDSVKILYDDDYPLDRYVVLDRDRSSRFLSRLGIAD